MEPQLFLLGGLGALLMGVSLGVFGAGGSILTVPLLVYIFRIQPALATLYSLLVVGVASAAGAWLDRGGKLPFGRIAWFALAAMAGMYSARNFLLPAMPEEVSLLGAGSFSKDGFILLVFALFMVAASFSMLLAKAPAEKKGSAHPLGLALVGSGVGLLTGFVGAGGGFLIVPALIFLAGIPVKEAAKASLFVIALNSLWGFFTSPVAWDAVPWLMLGLVVVLALAGMAMGVKIRGRIAAEKLKPVFGGFILLMGILVLWQSWPAG